MPFRILVVLDAPMLRVADGVLRERLGPDFEIVGTTHMYDEIASAAMPTVNAVVTHRGFGEANYEKAPQLRLFQKWGVRLDDESIEAGVRRGIPVCNVPDSNLISVAEHFFALLLALRKRIIPVHHSMSDGKWEPDLFIELGIGGLAGRTLGLVGFAISVRP